MKPRVVLFDLDDTLLDSGSCAQRCWSDCSAQFAATAGVEHERLLASIDESRRWFWSDPERHRRERTDMVRAWSQIAERALRSLECEVALARAIGVDYAARRRDAEVLFPDALPLLTALVSNGFRLGLVTNGDAAIQRGKIARHALAPYFEAIVIEGEFGRGKPDAEVYAHALAQLGTAPTGVWMVGDNLEWDVTGAQRAGLLGAWIDRARSGTTPDPRPDHILHDLTGLPDLVGA
jgi:putative hydrolase of the HAD superfamily